MSCSNQEKDLHTISFDLPENKGDTILVSVTNPLDFAKDRVTKLTLDVRGHGSLDLNWNDTVYVSIEVKDFKMFLLTVPGGNIVIHGSTKSIDSVLISGHNSDVNTYLNGINFVFQEHEFWNGKPFFALDSVEFIERKDLIRSEVSQLRTDVSRNIPDNEGLIQIIDLESEFRLLAEALNNELVNGKSVVENSNILLENSSYLETYSEYYSVVLAFYLASKLSNSIFDNYTSEEFDSINYIYPELIYDKIMNLETSTPLKEILSAKVLFNYFSSGVITPSANYTYDQWQSAFPNSTFSDQIAEKYQSVIILNSGIQAPEIIGLTPREDTLRLSDFKGKLVYIDVWATWCGPCIKSLPTLQKLEERLSEHGVMVLYVSIDRNIKKWQSFLKQKNLRGNHIVTNANDLKKNYMISGIPRYILIDTDGFIVDVNAKEPSDETLINEIIKLNE